MMGGKDMASIETLPDGRFALNVYTEEGIIKHVFHSMEDLQRYFNSSVYPNESDEYAGY